MAEGFKVGNGLLPGTDEDNLTLRHEANVIKHLPDGAPWLVDHSHDCLATLSRDCEVL